MAEMIIQNPSITTNVFEYDEVGRVSAISGHPLAGQGGGTIVKSDLMWKPDVGSDGYVHWTLASSATTPEAAYISGAQGPAGPTGPQGEQGPAGEKGDTGEKGDDATPLTAATATIAGGTQVTISYTSGGDSLAQFNVLSGAQGAAGTNGKDGISPTVSTETITGGNRVTFTYNDGGTTKTESIDVMSGVSGANGSDGFSPTVVTADIPVSDQFPAGGTKVTITDSDGPHIFDISNGQSGQGATVNLLGGEGIEVNKAGANYTISVSADYATKSYVDSASANAYDKAVAQIPNVDDFITKDVNNLTYYYNKTETSGANELATEFAKYVTSSNVSTQDTDYVMTTNGWKVLTLPGGGMTQVIHDTTLTGQGNADDNKLGVAWSALSGNTIASALSAGSATIAANLGTSSFADITGAINAKADATAISDMLTKTEASQTYQTVAGMSNYLTTTVASQTYQTIAGMSNYLTTTDAATTYLDRTTYATDSATFVTSSSNTITGTKQYALTTAGWMEVSTPTIPDITATNGISADGHNIGLTESVYSAIQEISVANDLVGANGISVVAGANNQVIIAPSGISLSKQYAMTTTGWEEVQAGTTFTGVTTTGSISGGGVNNDIIGLTTTAENALTAVAEKLDITVAAATYLDKTTYATDSATFVTSSNSTITGTKQYALTTTGWAEVNGFTGASADNGLSGNGLSTSPLGLHSSAAQTISAVKYEEINANMIAQKLLVVTSDQQIINYVQGGGANGEGCIFFVTSAH